MRLFFAVELPAEVRAALGRLRSGGDDYRWVDAAQLHMTLAFLGEQPEEALPQLEQIGATAAGGSSAGKLRLAEAGSFGPRSAPRVLWVGLGGGLPDLLALQANLARELRAGGFVLEDRPFSPHITLARRHERAAAGRPEWPPSADRIPSGTIPLRELVLFQSKLSPKGASYIALGTYPLRA
ncbi:MAG TPA: RNA 2',3'-cyclic phosphodiesterase [Chloroflexota bacterium]